MKIKHKVIIERSIHSDTEISVVSVDGIELQIQVEKADEDFFFDLGSEEAEKLRTALTEFIGDRGEIMLPRDGSN